MSRQRRVANVSMATRLSLVALIVTFVSLAVAASVGLLRGNDLADGIADDQLVTVAASRASEVEGDMTSLQRQIAALGTSPATRDAITHLGDAALALGADPPSTSESEQLTEYYLVDVIPALEDLRGARVGASFLVPDAAVAVRLQSAYTVPRPPAGTDEDDTDTKRTLIDPELVLDPGDGSEYSASHPAIHQTFGQIAAWSGLDDLFLIDARRDLIVYSVRKRIDFGTSLDLGPYSGSSLARLVDGLEESGDVRVTDFSAYVPAGERPTAFVAAPVVDGGRVIGYVAGAFSVDRIDEILSGGDGVNGFDDTGQVHLVGSDAVMRSTARSYREAPSEFLDRADEPGPGQLSDAAQRRVRTTRTTALVQSVDRALVDDALEGPGLTNATSHEGHDVRAAYRPIAVDGLTWTLIAEIDRDERDGPIEGYARAMLFAVALFIVAVTFIAVRWSNRVMAPVRDLATVLRDVRAGRAPPESAESVDSIDRATAPAEYAELSENIEQMLERLREREAEVEARSEERLQLLRRFLPATVARRSEEGDGDVLDHVELASVVVLTVEGLGRLVGERPDQDVRDLLAEVVDEVDALAADFGLERVKVSGSSYFAVCGVSRPYLDHAPRSVGFGLAAVDLVGELSEGALSGRGGVAAGPVSVGLAARSALSYDVWGETVTRADELARFAAVGTLAVTDAVRAQLPDDFRIDDRDGGWASVTGRTVEPEPSA